MSTPDERRYEQHDCHEPEEGEFDRIAEAVNSLERMTDRVERTGECGERGHAPRRERIANGEEEPNTNRQEEAPRITFVVGIEQTDMPDVLIEEAGCEKEQHADDGVVKGAEQNGYAHDTMTATFVER
jgi:hypothetical protein